MERASVTAARPNHSHEFYTFALALIRAQRRMLERWSEGDAAVRQQLWRDLHERGNALAGALPAPFEWPDERSWYEQTEEERLSFLDSWYAYLRLTKADGVYAAPYVRAALAAMPAPVEE